MKISKTTFALFFGNRGFFPAFLQSQAREEMTSVLKKLGHKTISLPVKSTPYGAIETRKDGLRYADFLRANQGKFGGVIACLPNFGDETGAVAALKDAGVPVLLHAYPDELDKLSLSHRRDAFCGKFSIMDVFCQYGIPFTSLTPHVVSPNSEAFRANVDYFDRLCRVYSGLKEMTVCAVGARTTAFKTVRFDELALQTRGVTVETVDLASVFQRIKETKVNSSAYTQKATSLKKYVSWKGVPEKAFDTYP